MQSLDLFHNNNNNKLNNKLNNSEIVLERSYIISARFTDVRNIQTKWKLIDRWFQGCSVFLFVVQDLTYLHNCLAALTFIPDPISSEMGETQSSSSLLREQAGDSPSPSERLELSVVFSEPCPLPRFILGISPLGDLQSLGRFPETFGFSPEKRLAITAVDLAKCLAHVKQLLSDRCSSVFSL